jgi:hypothetical protein
MDLIFTWNYSQDLTFTLAAGWLWDNEVHFDMDFYAPYIHDGPINRIHDDAGILILGTTLRF